MGEPEPIGVAFEEQEKQPVEVRGLDEPVGAAEPEQVGVEQQERVGIPLEIAGVRIALAVGERKRLTLWKPFPRVGVKKPFRFSYGKPLRQPLASFNQPLRQPLPCVGIGKSFTLGVRKPLRQPLARTGLRLRL